MTQFFLSSTFSHFELIFFSSFWGFRAGLAGSSSIMASGILYCVFMAMDTMGLFSLFSHNTFASNNIFSMRNSFEVLRVYAQFISTKMVEIQPLWDWSVNKFIGKSISFLNFIFSSGNVKYAVPFTIGASFPNPTCVSFFYLLPKISHGTINNVVLEGGKAWL